MKNAGPLCLFLSLIIGCTQKEYRVENSENPEFRANTVFASYENLSLPKFDSLRTKYKPDTVFHGEKDEFARILLLRNWIRSVIRINDFATDYPGEGYPEGILDAAMKGHGYHCGHYMVVQNAIMNAYGYVTRCLGSGPGVEGGPDGHHGINEIWVNKYKKWFLSDAKYNHHFEKNGIPLSALEVREEYLKNKAADIVLVKGAGRTVIADDGVANEKGVYVKRTKEQFAQWYTWLEWDMNNNRYSAWPDFNGRLTMYNDEYFKNHTWIWDGKPHWAYNTEHVKYVDERKAIEWTPNTINGNVHIGADSVNITLASITPNFKEYQVKLSPQAEWVKCDSSVTLALDKNTLELSFHAVNVSDVSGPEYKVVLTSN
ncbi:MAG: hypothetical protein JNK79_08930 [Chitinophagaceae bacterium]|nr:hypothetical protein [Chitinophagaceae bacterium]